MLRKIALTTASIYALWAFSPAPAAHAATRCSAELTPHAAAAAGTLIRCSLLRTGTPTVHVRVNGHTLTVAELSHRGRTATFYGSGAVVRFDQRSSDTVAVTAATVATGARVRVWLTPEH